MAFDASALLRSALRIGGALLVAYGVFALCVWLFAERMIFQPGPPTYPDGPGILKLRTTDGGTIAARWLPNPAARHTVLYSHGNAEDLGELESYLREMHAAGFAVLAYDYRGYGRSDAVRPTERKAYADAEAAYDHLMKTLGIPGERIILHGRSLGGGPSAHLAATRACAGLVLESTFVAIHRAYADPPLVPFDRFHVERRLKDARCPVLVIHGTADDAVRPWHGRRLFAAAKEPKWEAWFEGAGHNDLVYLGGERYWETLRRFSANVGSAPSRPTP